MHEDLEGHVGHGGMNGCYFIDRELTGKYYTTKACLLKGEHPLGSTVIGLCGCMESYGGEIHAKNLHVLHEDGIDTGLIELPDETFGLGEFVGMQEGVDCDKDFHGIAVGIVAELTNVIDRVTGSDTSTKTRSSDIDSIGTMINGCDTTLQILGGGQ